MSTFDHYLRERVANKDDPNLPQFARNKLETYDFCKKHDIPTPKIYKRIDDIQSYQFENLPEKFVLKPDKFWSSIGVFILKKQGASFLDIKTNKTYSSYELIKECQKINEDYYKRENDNLKFFVEELIEQEPDRMSYDYKAYTFYGEIGIIIQVDWSVHPRPRAFYDSNFKPMELDISGLGDIEPLLLFPHVRPTHYDQALKMIRKVSLLMKTPFVRIDLLADEKGVYLGELTLFPGGSQIMTVLCKSQIYNPRFGNLWYQAKKRIEKNITESKYFV